MHALHALCTILLHRETLPFLPLHSAGPNGPTGDNTVLTRVSRPRPTPTPGFWHDAAAQLFEAARAIADIAAAYHPRKMLAETPLVGFALYQASLLAVYTLHFPHMDPSGGASLHAAAPRALAALVAMRALWPQATDWLRTVHRLHRYYERAAAASRRTDAHTARFFDHAANQPSNGPTRLLPLRDTHAPADDDLARALHDLARFDAPDAPPPHPPDASPRTPAAHRPAHRPSFAGSSDTTASSRTSATTAASHPSTAATASQPSDAWTPVNSTSHSTSLGPAERDAGAGGRASPYAPPPPHVVSPAVTAAASGLPPLYQLAAVVVEDSQQLLQQQHRQRGDVPTPTPLTPPRGYEDAARMAWAGDDVVFFVEGRGLEEGRAVGGAGWRAQGWLREIWRA